MRSQSSSVRLGFHLGGIKRHSIWKRDGGTSRAALAGHGPGDRERGQFVGKSTWCSPSPSVTSIIRSKVGRSGLAKNDAPSRWMRSRRETTSTGTSGCNALAKLTELIGVCLVLTMRRQSRTAVRPGGCRLGGCLYVLGLCECVLNTGADQHVRDFV
jgi:hypothetical protein